MRAQVLFLVLMVLMAMGAAWMVVTVLRSIQIPY